MLPFDNKSEFQVLVDHDAGTPLEVTLETARRMSRALAAVPEVSDVQIYAGTAAPYNFNGLVRHYFLRRSPSGADLQVNLVGKHDRSLQSHDLAKKVRPALQEIAKSRGARVKVIEIPPGPPVLDTLVAEIYGPSAAAREGLAGHGARALRDTRGDRGRGRLARRRRASGWPWYSIARRRGSRASRPRRPPSRRSPGPGAGRDVGRLDVPASREPVPVRLRLSAADRGDLERRLSLRVDAPGRGGGALGQIARVERAAGAAAHPAQGPEARRLRLRRPRRRAREPGLRPGRARTRRSTPFRPGRTDAIERLRRRAAPSTSDRLALKWDGEWQITYEVFRDLGIAFAVVLVLIAILVIGWFQSFTVPLAILLPIPLSLIGILPGHWAFGAFFTATSMIGFIAGAGIIVRNSIILVDFIELKLRQGMPLEEAVVEAGAVRFRPMLLTAAAVVVGSLVILFDPIFQGLAISLMMGEVAATFLSRMAVPVVYYLIARRGRATVAAPGRPGAGRRLVTQGGIHDRRTSRARPGRASSCCLSVALGYWVHPALLPLHRLRGGQPLPVRLHERVPGHDRLPAARPARRGHAGPAMKALVLITDSEAMKAFERAFVESGDRGFTIVPTVIGRGRTGLKAGDRIHPGGSSLLFSVLAEAEVAATLAFVRGIRDAAGVRDQTKLYLAPVEEVS